MELASERHLPENATAFLSSYHDGLRRQLPEVVGDGIESPGIASRFPRELIEIERRHLHQMLREGRITDESRRRMERELDLEEATLISRAQL